MGWAEANRHNENWVRVRLRLGLKLRLRLRVGASTIARHSLLIANIFCAITMKKHPSFKESPCRRQHPCHSFRQIGRS